MWGTAAVVYVVHHGMQFGCSSPHSRLFCPGLCRTVHDQVWCLSVFHHFLLCSVLAVLRRTVAFVFTMRTEMQLEWSSSVSQLDCHGLWGCFCFYYAHRDAAWMIIFSLTARLSWLVSEGPWSFVTCLRPLFLVCSAWTVLQAMVAVVPVTHPQMSVCCLSSHLLLWPVSWGLWPSLMSGLCFCS